ncbi:type IV toxin-antitoxin system AbiEi family antitoxin domain-containing protein [Candidatus Dependentiae bacterium]|nr:type IV toxin-antitoxin system AbiEi family antitoxin domain-containing protein [Candidatus Dependentiae bacterium]
MTLARDMIGRLSRELGEVFKVSEVASILNITSLQASKSLSRWAKQGLIRRIHHGLYSVIPIEALSTDQPLDNMWVVLPEIFSPGYIGGWSAAEYWDFTEQIFRDVCVITEKRLTHKKYEIVGITYILTHRASYLTFGTEVVWIKNKKAFVSDPHKTILDMLYTPTLGGGIEHTIDCFKQYIKSSYYDSIQLVNYAKRMHNGALFKRLGYLSEKILGEKDKLTTRCLAEITKGASYIDPSLKKGKYSKRWRLYVPSHLKIEEFTKW